MSYKYTFNMRSGGSRLRVAAVLLVSLPFARPLTRAYTLRGRNSRLADSIYLRHIEE